MVGGLLALDLIEFGANSIGLIDGRLFDIFVTSLEAFFQLTKSRHLH